MIRIKKKTLCQILQLTALIDEFKVKDYRVLLYLIPKLRKDDYVRINQSSMAEDLNITKSDVSKAIKKLVEYEILELDDIEAGWKNTLRLYPYDDYSVWEKIDYLLYGEFEEEDED